MVAAALHLPASYESEIDLAARVDALIELMGLGAFRDKLLGELSSGSRRIVELACILAQDPAVVLLDEPSAGVAQRETEALGPLLRRVQAYTGCSMLVIEHDMPLIAAVSDEVIALELGGVIARGTPAGGAVPPPGGGVLPGDRRRRHRPVRAPGLKEVEEEEELHHRQRLAAAVGAEPAETAGQRLRLLQLPPQRLAPPSR